MKRRKGSVKYGLVDYQYNRYLTHLFRPLKRENGMNIESL